MFEADILKQITRENGTPVYVYDQQKILENIGYFRRIRYRKLKIYFAAMANSNIELLKILRCNGIGVLAPSVKLLYTARKAGYHGEITYAGTNLSREDIKHIIKNDVIFNADSPSQLELYCFEGGKKAGLRINYDCDDTVKQDLQFLGESGRLGMREREIPQAIRIARKYGVTIDGVHVSFGTNIKDVNVFLHAVDLFFEFIKKIIHPQVPSLRYIDLGGGVGAKETGDKSFDYEVLGKGLKQRVVGLNRDLRKEFELAIEPGRALLGDTAVFLTKVTDIKHREKKTLIGTDASITTFPMPILSGDPYHEVKVLGKEDETAVGTLSDICGKTAYARDYLAKDIYLPPVEVGDILVLPNAGSYCFGMMSEFLGMLKPPEVLISDGSYRIIREGERAEII
ncbi:MAG: hypothetical protein K8T10_03390 [Candidatus Eremiobacteraeota bacterium]|nr:hypothetical protein [Candidatus Eremiobacteraeota bacterium]